MPLPPTEISRHRLHQRSIVLEGWQRDDGLWDIEARLVDRKDHDYPLASGVRLQGEAIHDMWIRVTVDQQLNVHDAVASSDSVPYPGGVRYDRSRLWPVEGAQSQPWISSCDDRAI